MAGTEFTNPHDSTTYIVDAYNLLHRAYREDLEHPQLETARGLLEARLRRFQAAHRRSLRIVVVWDGDPFSVYTRARWVFVDGVLRYDRDKPGAPWSDFELGQEVPR